MTSATTESDVEQSAPVPAEEADRSRSGLLRLLLAGLVVLLVAAAAVLGYQVHRASTLAQARQAALAAARQEALNLASVSQASLDADLKAVLGGATGDFRSEYGASESDLRRVVTTNQVTSTGNVIDAGLVHGDRNSAVALVIIDATVKNKDAPNGVPRYYRMQLAMTRQGATWLTSTLQLVG